MSIRARLMALCTALLLCAGCVETPQDRLVENFRTTHSDESWFEAVDGIDVNGAATIVIHTKLDPLDPNVEELAVEICEAMASSTPSEDEVFINLIRLIPGGQNVDGSYEDARPQEVGIAETISFAEDTCEAEMYPTWIDDQREAIGQLES